MSDFQKTLRVFLASPSDLKGERETVRETVIEFNECLADEFGCQVKLGGWEDAVASYGRPQYLINKDVERCDLFIGLIWKRWGTPPDGDGHFSSGFHEEYEQFIARREKSNRPEIALYFKDIPSESLEDPGEQLKRVIAFRNTIIAGQKILFQEFSTSSDLKSLVWKRLIEFVKHVKANETPKHDEIRTKEGEHAPEREYVENQDTKSSPLSAEGFEFLQTLVDTLEQKNAFAELSTSHIARFRLLANSVTKPGNEEMYVGVNDLNLLFPAYVQGTDLGEREKIYLLKWGFIRYGSENVPLWRWYSELSNDLPDLILESAYGGANDNERIGAIRVMHALARELPTDDEWPKKNGSWFSPQSTAGVKLAALAYLMDMGTAEDYAVAKKEYDRSDSGTSQKALEYMVGILLRTGQADAARQLVLESSFESLETTMLSAVLSGFTDIEAGALRIGLEHSNAQVRLRALEILVERNALTQEVVERMCSDSDVFVRKEAMTALSGLGKALTDEDAKAILVKPQKGLFRGGLLRHAAGISQDIKGEDLFSLYQLEKLKEYSDEELTQKVEFSLVHDNLAYFARAERYFSKHAGELRRNVDDAFSGYVNEQMERMESVLGNSSALKNTITASKEVDEFHRKNLTRRGLDILCSARKREDLERIRKNLKEDFAGASKADAKYLEKHGQWTDITLLSNATEPPSGGLLIRTEESRGFHAAVSKAILSMSRGYSVSGLFCLDIPANILKKAITLCSDSQFAEISRESLLVLLDHDSKDVRRAAAIKAVTALSVEQVKSTLHKYISDDKHRYYNVIHWLDLGASMPRHEARKVAHGAIQ